MSDTGKVPISVVVITRNEAANIADCLKSAHFADEIIVLDDHSTDDTVKIARQFTNKVFSRKMDIEGIHRNYAYGLAKNNWVLSLDADERMTEELGEELRELFNPSTLRQAQGRPEQSRRTTGSGLPSSEVERVNDPLKDKAFTIPIKAYIGDRWIRYGGWYPAPKVRLFDKRFFKYEEVEVHPRVFIQGSCGHLKKDIVHYSYRDFHDFFESLNNQTTLEAKKWFKGKRKIGFLKMCRKFIDRFLKSYILKQGFRDGFLGFVVAYGSGLYQFMSYAKYWQMLKEEEGKK